MQSDIYIGFYNKQPVAMFSLEEHTFDKSFLERTGRLLKACELSYVYVKEEYRGLGFGNQIIEEAKTLAIQNKKTCIILDTLKPDSNNCIKESRDKVDRKTDG